MIDNHCNFKEKLKRAPFKADTTLGGDWKSKFQEK